MEFDADGYDEDFESEGDDEFEDEGFNEDFDETTELEIESDEAIPEEDIDLGEYGHLEESIDTAIENIDEAISESDQKAEVMDLDMERALLEDMKEEAEIFRPDEFPTDEEIMNELRDEWEQDEWDRHIDEMARQELGDFIDRKAEVQDEIEDDEEPEKERDDNL